MFINMAAGSTGSTFPKWQLAILLGAPIAIGLGYLYLKNRHEDPEKKHLAEVAAKKTISLDEETAKPESSLDRATKYKIAGNHAFRSGNYEEAVKLYNQAIEACPPDHPKDLATYYQNRSACYEKWERWEKVIEDCTKALSLNDKYVRAFLRRSRAAEKSHDLVLALEDVTTACILEEFREHSSMVMADRILKALGKQYAKEAMPFKTPLMPSKYFIKTYFRSFTQDPIMNSLDLLKKEDATTGFLKAKLALKNHNYDDVIGYCTQEIENPKPEHIAEALLLRGTFFLLLGNYKEALVDLSTLIEMDANVKLRVNALIKRASMYIQIEDVYHCQKDCEEAALLDPENCDVHHHWGQTFLLLEMVEEACREFNKAVELNSDFAIAFIQDCYARYTVMKVMNQSEFSGIMQDFEKALVKFPECSEAYILYAEVLSDQGNFTRATDLFDKAIEIDPENATILVNKAMMSLKQNREINTAVNMITDAINLDNKCLFAYETLGTIEAQRHNLEMAINLFEKAVMLARTENEMSHLYALKAAASTQLKIAEKWKLSLSNLNPIN